MKVLKALKKWWNEPSEEDKRRMATDEYLIRQYLVPDTRLPPEAQKMLSEMALRTIRLRMMIRP